MNIFGLMKLKGTMQFPLAGSQNEHDFKKESKFTHDFALETNRNLIFSKPRKYKFFIGLADYDGFVFDETEYHIPDLVTKAELTQVIKQVVASQIMEYPNHEIDLSKSYVRIQL